MEEFNQVSTVRHGTHACLFIEYLITLIPQNVLSFLMSALCFSPSYPEVIFLFSLMVLLPHTKKQTVRREL